MKKTLLLIVIGAILGSTVGFAGSKLFPDVDENAWYADAVASLSEKGIIQGYPDGTFGPNKNVNRAELAVILDRLLEYIETGEVSSNEDTSDDDASDDDLANDFYAPIDESKVCGITVKSEKLLDLYYKLETTIINANQYIKEASTLMEPSVYQEEGYAKGVVAELSENFHSSAIEMNTGDLIFEDLYTNIVQEGTGDSLNFFASVYTEKGGNQNIQYVTENCGDEVDGICYDHLLFPLQISVTIDNTAMTASLSTITTALGSDPQTAEESVSYSEAVTIYDCIKADIKEVVDTYGKTPEQW